ncbi:helix-turn-helix domain-containing protein [Actinomadura harenae]|uniref:helix-turn-helix domain-containing protein n=1 Tax=Actinomadura harenae TaxID=2483351 RepID=UPI00131518DB|nr:helix-turn-helix transcriptional regulator [Actinomadura harenae]
MLLNFGLGVKRFRLSANLNQEELGKLTNVSRSYVTLVETGRTRCRRDYAERLDEALHASGEIIRAWDDLLQEFKAARYPASFGNFPRAEDAASMLRSYEDRLVYGLFQTEAYATVLLQDESKVRARMMRQEVLSRDVPPAIHSVMDEAVLYREVGNKQTMREQLEYLYELSHRPNITIQVLPVIYVRNLWAAFSVASQADQKELGYTEKAYGGETSSAPDDLALLNETFARLQAEASNIRETRSLIRKVIDERWT